MSDFTDSSFEESDEASSIDELDVLESNSEFSPMKRKADLDDSTLEKASRFLFAEDLVAYVSREFYSISYEVNIKKGREMLHDAFNESIKFVVDLIRWKIQKVHCPLLKSFGELCKCNKLYYQRFVRSILKYYSCQNANPGTFLFLCVYFTELATGCYSPQFPEILDCAVYAIIDAISVLNKEWKKIDAVAEALILPPIEDYSNSVYKPSSKLIQQDTDVEHPNVEESALKRNINYSKTLKTCSEVEKTLTITYCINESDAMKQSLSETKERTDADKNCVEMKKMDASNVTNEVICNSLLKKRESEEKVVKLDLPVNGVKASYEADECEDLSTVSISEKNVERIRKIPFDLEKLKLLTEENKCACCNNCVSMSTKKEIVQIIKKIIAELEKYEEIDESVDVCREQKTKKAIQKNCAEMGELKVNESSKSEEIICSLPLAKNGNDEISFTTVDNGNEIVSQLNSGGTDSAKHFCPQNYKSSDSLSKVNEDLLNEVISIVRSEVRMFLSEFLSSYSYTTLDSCAGSQSDNDECTKLNENLKLFEIKSSDLEVLKDQLEHSSPTFTGETEVTLTQPVDVQRQENEEIVDSNYGILTDSNSHAKIGNELQGNFLTLCLCEEGCNAEHLILLNRETLIFAEDLVAYIFSAFYGIPYNEPTCNECQRKDLHSQFNETIKQAVHFIHQDMINLSSLVFKYVEHVEEFSKDSYQSIVSRILSCYYDGGLSSKEFLYQCIFFVALASGYSKSGSPEAQNFALNAIMDAFCLLTEDWNGLHDAAAKIVKISRAFCIHQSRESPSYDENLNLSFEDYDTVAGNYLKEDSKIINDIRKYICNLKGSEIENEKGIKYCNPFFKFDENIPQCKPIEKNNTESISLEDLASISQTVEQSKELTTFSNPFLNDEGKQLLALSLEFKSVIYKSLVTHRTYVVQNINASNTE